MGELTQSYVHGASSQPLIGDTIGVHLDRMAALSPSSGEPNRRACRQESMSDNLALSDIHDIIERNADSDAPEPRSDPRSALEPAAQRAGRRATAHRQSAGRPARLGLER